MPSIAPAEPTLKPRNDPWQPDSAGPKLAEPEESYESKAKEDQSAPAPNDRADFSMAGNGEPKPELNGNPALAPMKAVPESANPSKTGEGKEEKEKEEKQDSGTTEFKLEGAATGGDEGTGAGDEGQGSPAGGAGTGGTAGGEDESKPKPDQKESAEGEKKEQEPTAETADKEGDDKKKIAGKSPKEFQEAGQKADKDQAVPQNTNPHKDKGFRGAIYQTKKAKASQGAHKPTSLKVIEGVLAGPVSEKEQDSKNAQQGHIGKMDGIAKANEKKKRPFTPEKFKKLLKKHLDKLEDNLPTDKSSAKTFKRTKPISKAKEAIADDVKKQNEAVSGPMASEAKQKDPPPSKVKATKAEPIPEDKAGVKPRGISAAAAVPKRKNDSELSMKKESQSLDDYMAENKVTEEQLAKSNEPTFIEALGKKKDAQKKAEEAPKEFRTKENTTLKRAKQSAYSKTEKGFEGMNVARKEVFAKVLTGQGQNVKDDQSKQRIIYKKLETIYNKTKKDVTKQLDDLSTTVDSVFSKTADAAKRVFERNVEKRLDDIYGITVIDDWLFGEDTEAIERAFRIEKAKFIKTMNGVLDLLAKYIAAALNKAIKTIKDGRKKSDEYFNSLSKDQQKLAKDAFDDFNDQYHSLEETVHDKQGEIAEGLARAYNQNVKALRESFDKIKKKVSAGWIGAAFNFIAGVVKTIIKIKKLLFNLLSAAISAIGAIIADPIGFLKNLIGGIKQGFVNFGKNLLSNIMTGLIEWLTGSLEGVRINIPKNLFSLSGIFSLVTQILGLTWDYFRAKAVKLVGEPLVKVMETGIEIFKIVRAKGVDGLWEYIKDQFSNLKEMVMDAIRDMIITKVIEAGIKWILGLMSPAGAFVKAAMMIIDIVRFFIERASQIFDLVQAFIDGIRALANGNVAAVAKAIEKALVKAIPILISFLAALVGITGLTKRVQKIIKKVRGKIDRVITKIIKKARKAFGKLVKKGKKKVKGAIKGLIQWWKARKKFKTKDGKQHSLYLKGGKKKAEFMIASTPMRVDAYLRKNKELLSTGETAGAYKNAVSLSKQIGKLVDQAEAVKDLESKAGKSKVKKINKKITGAMDKLSGVMIHLMGLKDVDMPKKAVWKYTPSFKDYPKKVSAQLLSKDTARGGSKPGANNASWPYIKDNNLTDLWVRLHLVSEKLGGKGIAQNLVPGPKTINSAMEQYSENPLKSSLGKTSDRNKKLKHKSVIWVETSVSYYSETVTDKGVKYHFANNIVVKGGFHFFDINKNKWIKNEKAVFSRNYQVPMPSSAKKKPLNMNTATRAEMLELDFKAAGLSRSNFKKALDASYEKFLKHKSYSGANNVDGKMRTAGYKLSYQDGNITRRTRLGFFISDLRSLQNAKLIVWN